MTDIDLPADSAAVATPVVEEATPSPFSKKELKRRAWVASQEATRLAMRPTAPLRVLPDFLVIGTQRGGSTSLHRTLLQHEGVMGARLTKGVHWWDAHPEKDLGWYQSHWPLRAAVDKRTEELGYRPAIGEASPVYMFGPTIPARIAKDLPGIRLIAILRDPVGRAWSHYHHEVRRGFETRSFVDAIAAEDEDMRRAEEQLRADPTLVHHGHLHHAYRWRGRYVEQLERVFAAVGRQRTLVLFSDDLRNDPVATMNRCADFLSIPHVTEVASEKANTQSNPKLDKALAAELRAEFDPWDDRLEELLGEKLPWRS